jgi:serine/threonine-protein kinase BUR1
MAIASLETDDNGQPRFPGCSNIRDFAFIDKLGEGTFGFVCFGYSELYMAD